MEAYYKMLSIMKIEKNYQYDMRTKMCNKFSGYMEKEQKVPSKVQSRSKNEM